MLWVNVMLYRMMDFLEEFLVVLSWKVKILKKIDEEVEHPGIFRKI